jgi:hypothetical protein
LLADATADAAAKKKTAEAKRRIAADLKIEAAETMTVASTTIDSLIVNASTAEAKLNINVVASVAASGGKLNNVNTVAVTATTDACVTLCADAKVDCVNVVICEEFVAAVSAGALSPVGGRHLLAETGTTLVINPEVTVTEDVEANLQAKGTTTTTTTEEPAARLAALGKFGVSVGKLAILMAQVTASATASRQLSAAESEAIAAENDYAEAEKLILSAELTVTVRTKANVSPPPPPPGLFAVSGAASLRTVLFTMVVAVNAALLQAC